MHRIKDMSVELKSQYDAGKHIFNGANCRSVRLELARKKRILEELEASRVLRASRFNADGSYKWSASELAAFRAG